MFSCVSVLVFLPAVSLFLGSHRAVENKTVIVIGCKITKSFSIHQKTGHFVIIYRHLMTPACAGGGMSGFNNLSDYGWLC